MIMQVSFKKYDWIDENLIKVECLNSLLNLLFSTLHYQVGLLLTMDSWFSQMQLQFILRSPFGHQPRQCCPVMQWMTMDIQQYEECIDTLIRTTGREIGLFLGCSTTDTVTGHATVRPLL